MENSYDLVVLGIHLRRGWGHLRPKFVARHVVHRIEVPLLIVFPEWRQLRRILVCTAGEKHAEQVVDFAGRLTAPVGAEIVILHVMSQIPMASDADVEDLVCDAEGLIEHSAPEGKHLERTLEILANLGIPAERCRAKVRHGFVVDEIVRESEEGDVDLVVLGAPAVSKEHSRNGLDELLREDVADRVLMDARRPVLIV
jgi:nucleotide-binding universal stress UspA family protein